MSENKNIYADDKILLILDIVNTYGVIRKEHLKIMLNITDADLNSKLNRLIQRKAIFRYFKGKETILYSNSNAIMGKKELDIKVDQAISVMLHLSKKFNMHTHNRCDKPPILLTFTANVGDKIEMFDIFYVKNGNENIINSQLKYSQVEDEFLIAIIERKEQMAMLKADILAYAMVKDDGVKIIREQ